MARQRLFTSYVADRFYNELFAAINDYAETNSDNLNPVSYTHLEVYKRQDTESGNINFHYADKVFLTMLKKANKSWEKKEDKKYFLILDDISRGAISGILGDMLPLIEPHGLNVYRTVLSLSLIHILHLS